MKTKRKVMPGIVILTLGICIISGIIIFSKARTDSWVDVFVQSRTNIAVRLYEAVKYLDFENDYPKSPEDVTDVYNDTVLLLYGDMILDEDVRKEVITVQRELLSTDILENNSFDSQYENLLSSTKQLYDKGIRASEFSKGVAFISSTEPDTCIIPVKQMFTNQTSVYWNYYLKKQDSKWKIYSRKLTDDQYRPLEQ